MVTSTLSQISLGGRDQWMAAGEVVKALGGRNGSARCPAHRDRNPSLSVSDGPDGRLLVHCHAGCSQEAVIAALRVLGLWSNGRPDNEFRTAHDRSRLALAIWREAEPITGTSAAEYLAGRGIICRLPECLRSHPALLHHGIATPALLAAITDPGSGFMGVQRIFLERHTWGVEKIERLSLGPTKGGAVHLTPPAGRLQVTESVEDGLALLQMTGRATWAVPGASFLASFEPPEGCHELILAPDHDRAGIEAIAKAVATSDHFYGVRLRQLLPPQGMDWCDVLEDHEERKAIQEEPSDIAQSRVEELVNGV
jgi:putative DNA primase/helicase